MNPKFHLLTYLLLLVITLMGCEKQTENQAKETIRPVRTVEASPIPTEIQRRFAGTTISASTTELSFRVNGIIEAFPATVGVKLNAGDTIAQINDDELQLKLQQNIALLQQAKTKAAASSSRFKRVTKLYEKHAISGMDFDNAKAEYHSDKARVFQAQQAVELSRQQIQYTHLTAPVDNCVITESYATVNENVLSGQAIATMSCGSEMEVMAIVPEGVVKNLSIGRPVSVMIKTISDQPIPAILTEIGLSYENSGAYFVTTNIIKRSDILRSGMAAELIITREFKAVKGHFWVPMVAINEENGQKYVMTYEPKQESNGVVRKTPIKIGRFAMGAIEVTDGLEEGQQVITAGLSQIHDGMEVKQLPKAVN